MAALRKIIYDNEKYLQVLGFVEVITLSELSDRLSYYATKLLYMLLSVSVCYLCMLYELRKLGVGQGQDYHGHIVFIGEEQ